MSNTAREHTPKKAVVLRSGRARRVQSGALTAHTAAELFGALSPGCDVFALSKGYTSFGAAVGYLLDVAGPSDVFLSTWTIGAAEIGGLRRLVDSGRIRSLRLLVDPSFVRRHRAYAALLRATFGAESIRLVKLHAKLAVVHNASWALVLRSSANLNANHRVEFFELSDDPALAACIVDTLGSWFDYAPSSQWDASARAHADAFDAWQAPADAGPVVQPTVSRERPIARRTAPAGPATAEDAAFFSPEPFGTDLRRVGVSYL